jgi:TPP-dependent 2-oxoacid decarboxylase
LKNLDWTNLIVAQGIVLVALMAGKGGYDEWCSSDIGVYVYGLSSAEATQKIRHVLDTFCSRGTRRRLPFTPSILCAGYKSSSSF